MGMHDISLYGGIYNIIFKVPFFFAEKLVLYINPNKISILSDCNGVSQLELRNGGVFSDGKSHFHGNINRFSMLRNGKYVFLPFDSE